jgi:multicomponent Na+:H+ antiporter subunit C
MTIPTIFGICASVLIGLGLYGIIIQTKALRKLLAFNLVGTGVFLLFGVIGRRGAAGGLEGDPVVFGLVITGIVVAFSATALAVTILLRLHEETGDDSLLDPPTDEGER